MLLIKSKDEQILGLIADRLGKRVGLDLEVMKQVHLIKRFGHRRKAHRLTIPTSHEHVSPIDLYEYLLDRLICGPDEKNPPHHRAFPAIDIFDRGRRGKAVFCPATEYGEQIRHDHHAVSAQIDAADLFPLQFL